MRRENFFAVGGGLLVALAAALAAGFQLWEFSVATYPIDLGVGASLVLAAIFFAASRDARRYRLEYLRAVEEGHPLPDDGPPR